MGSSDNLKSFKKGESGNPRGRPKGAKNRSTAFKKFLSIKTLIDNPDNGQLPKIKGTIEEKMAAVQIKKALEGNTYAFREVMDCVYGREGLRGESPESPPAKNGQARVFTIIDSDGESKTLELGAADEETV